MMTEALVGATVVDLDGVRPHVTGIAVCPEPGCHRWWLAVAPVGCDRLECPACGAWGLWAADWWDRCDGNR